MHYETLNVLQFIAKQEILGFEENFTANQQKHRTTKLKPTGSSNQRDDLGKSKEPEKLLHMNEEHTTAPIGQMPTMGRRTASLDSVPSFMTDLDNFLDPKPIGSNEVLVEGDHLFEAERKADNFKQERYSPFAANTESLIATCEQETDNFKEERCFPVTIREESSFELKSSNAGEQPEINVAATESINDRISQSQGKFDAIDQSEQGIETKNSGTKQRFDIIGQSEQRVDQGNLSSKQQTIGSVTTEVQALAVEDTNVKVASEDAESLSLSGGSLADVSSLASNQPRDDLKTRSSKRKMRRRAKSNEMEMSASSTSDESEDELMMRLQKGEDDGLEFPKRESSVSLVFSEANLGRLL